MTSDARFGAALALTLALIAGDATAQTFREDISITEVEVPVQVLIDNRAVAGLEREDFEILVDGEPQELIWFQAIELEDSGLVAGPRVPTSRPAAVSIEAPATTAPSWSRHYLVLFDYAYSRRDRLRRAVEGVREMLGSQIHSSDRLAIALYAPTLGARLLVPFTADRDGLELGLSFLEATLATKRRQSVERLEQLDAWWRERSRHSTLPEPMLADLGPNAHTLIQPKVKGVSLAGLGIPMGRPPADGADDGPEARHEYQLSRLNWLFSPNQGGTLGEVSALSRSLASLVTLLRDVPEPKHLFYLSEGDIFSGAETVSVLERVKSMLDAFRATGWTLQAIDLTGIAPPPASALTGPEDFDGDLELRGTGVEVVSAFADDSLFYFANETGGQVYENYNRIHQATEKILERSRVTYLLTFQPQGDLLDGRRHDIQVRLTREIKGARVLHRPGFRTAREPLDRSLTERRMDAAEVALGGEELAELRMTALPVVVPDAEGATVPIFVELPADDLHTGRKGRKKVRLDLHAYALDESGEVRGGFTRHLGFRLRGEEAVTLTEEIELPPGAYELRLLAWDLRSGRQRLARLPIEVEPLSPDRPRLVGPVFLDGSRSRRELQPATDAAGAAALFRLQDTPNRPRSTAVVLRGSSRRFLVLIVGAEPGDEAALQARVTNAPGSWTREVSFERVDDGARPVRQLVGVLDGSHTEEPGDYRLEVVLIDADGAAQVSSASFEVVSRPASSARE